MNLLKPKRLFHLSSPITKSNRYIINGTAACDMFRILLINEYRIMLEYLAAGICSPRYYTVRLIKNSISFVLK